MLAHEWRELEVLCARIDELRERLDAAHKTGNTGLIEGLDADIDRIIRQRNQLVRHISTRLGSTAADRLRASRPAARDASRGRVGGPVAIPH
jgi:hypothetical protein